MARKQIGKPTLLSEDSVNKGYLAQSIREESYDHLIDPTQWSGPVGTRLTIPTHVTPAGGQTTHPSVLYFPDKWNGYHYWMGHTPYPAGNDDHEDPNLAVSNDGVTWIAAPGVTQPLDDADGTPEYNSDINLAMGPNDTMYMFWRYYDSGLASLDEKFYVRTSRDGVTWTTKVAVWEANDTAYRYMSPSFIWEDNRWTFWAVDILTNPNRVIRRQATAGVFLPVTASWGSETLCNVGTMQSGKEPWHLEVIRMGARYVMLLTDCTLNVSGTNGDILLLVSQDGITWTNSVTTVIPRLQPAEHDQLYKASMVPTFNDGILGLQVWYSAWIAAGNVWNVYKTWIGPQGAGDSATSAASLIGTWITPSMNSLERVDDVCVFRFNATKSSTGLASGAAILDIPVGFRTNANLWSHGWGLNGATAIFPFYYDAGTHQIKINAALGASQSVAITLTWNVTG